MSAQDAPKRQAIAPPPSPLQDGRSDFNVVFIHSRLDEYGLTPQQFRVYAHLARRAGSGRAWPAVATMARICRLHPQTVRQVLRVLVQHRLITREPRAGRTPIYRLTPASQWQPLTRITGNPSESDTPPSVSGSTPAKRRQAHPCERDEAEGYPSEGNKMKEIQAPISPKGVSMIDQSFSLSSQAEEIYAEYPKKVGKPNALRAIKRALKSVSADFLLQRTKLFASTYNGEPRFIPHPATWFNGERFNDDPETWCHKLPPSGKHQPGIIKPSSFTTQIGKL